MRLAGKPVIGLTGGIGSGKSTVADAFAALGATVVDTDAIAHVLTGPAGAAMLAIREAFGPGVVAADGRLDRTAMRQLSFNDPTQRRRLESILHPLIRMEADTQVAAALARPEVPYVLLVVPLLVESGGYRERVDHIVVVDCDEATQMARVMARSGLSGDEVARIIAAQAPRAARLEAAGVVIDNTGPPERLAGQVGALDREWRRKSSV